MEATETKNLVLIETPYGTIKVRLYDETPQHRDNFIKLVESQFYDSLMFHRVIKDFMIQGGDPESKNAPANAQLGAGGPGYQVPAEIVYPQLFHKRGALSAARTGDQVNPMKASSGSQFYIVWGKVYGENELKSMEQQKVQQAMRTHFNNLAFAQKDSIQAMQANNNTAGLDALEKELIAKTEAEFMLNPDKGRFTAEQKAVYTTVGGTPFLDGEYTVFGEVVEGLEIVDQIQRCQTGTADRPKSDITMTMRMVAE
ncbi:MAG: peptidylprolyl isomerase [Bacteroidales bacterium]|nr:peptidylprolyl isomerase [Bacteroidales bacterium]